MSCKGKTEFVVTDIIGQDSIYDEHPNYSIQRGNHFYTCQNIERYFPMCIIFFICKTEIGNMKCCSDAATDIRWVSVENLKQMLDTKQELFFLFIYGVLKNIKSILFE